MREVAGVYVSNQRLGDEGTVGTGPELADLEGILGGDKEGCGERTEVL
jgi:hypothetical protein